MTINKALAMQLLDLQHRLQEAEGIVAGLFDGPVFQSTNIQPRMCSGVTEPPVMWSATAHALGCGMNNGRPVLACVCGLPNKDLVFPDPDLTRCPKCGGPADNGHDRCLPPNPYACSKCQPPADPPIPAMPERQHDPVAGLERESSYIRRTEAHARELERRLEEALEDSACWKRSEAACSEQHDKRMDELDAARAEVARLKAEVADKSWRLEALVEFSRSNPSFQKWSDEQRNKTRALQAQVQTLAEALSNLVSWVENMGEFSEDDPVWLATVRESRAALASLEVKP